MEARILLPLNGRVEAEAALLPALLVASFGRADLELLWVIPPPPANRHLSKVAREVSLWASTKVATRHLCRLSREVTRHWPISVHWLIRQGPVHEVILHVITERESSFVVMASHYHCRVKRCLLGSISQRVALASPVPVLLVPVTPRATLPSWRSFKGWRACPRAT